jgi:YVTN family beta-propeller protein
MSTGSSKSKSNRNILGIFGVVLLLFGILSLIFQYSNTSVNNMNAYAQVDLGPFVPIGPPNRSTALDAVSDGSKTYVSYAAEQQGAFDPGVYLALLLSGTGGRGESLEDAPENVVPDGEDPAIAVGGDKIYVTGTRDGQGDIAFTECESEDDDNCEPPQSASNPPPPIETSCFDGVDGDGDGVADELDSDCAGCFIFPDSFNLGSGEARIQFVSGPACPFEPGPDCDDGVDNDGDGVADEADPDCNIEGSHISGPNCDDGIDNDGDELTDGEDPGCNEAGEEACSDGIDNDGDGATDGLDPGCIVNLPPNSDAGSDQTVDEGATVTLDGTNSSDPDNNTPLAYNWTQTAGPSVTLSDPNAAQPTFTAPEVDPDSTEVLTFELTVTDSQGLEDPTPDSVTITVNDVAGGGVVSTESVAVEVGENPNFLAFSPVNERMYIANEGSDSVSMIGYNPATDSFEVFGPIEVGDQPEGVAFNPANNMIYVANSADDTVSVIDGDTVVDTIDVGDGPWGLEFNPDNELMYVAEFANDTVSFITSANEIAGTVSVVDEPSHITYNSANGKMYVSNYASDDVSVLEDDDGIYLEDTISVGDGPAESGFNPVNNKVYVPNYDSDTISLIEGFDVTDTIDVGDQPNSAVFDATHNHMWVTIYNEDTVCVFDDTSLVYVDCLDGFDGPSHLAHNPLNGKMYVTNYDNGTVSIITTKEIACSNGEDDDNDGATDGADPDCVTDAGLSFGPNQYNNNNLFQSVGLVDGVGIGGHLTTTTITTTTNSQQQLPQLIPVQNGGGGDTPPPATNSDIATSTADGGDDVYIVWEQEGDIKFLAGHGCADENGCEFEEDILNMSSNSGTSKEPRVATSSDGTFVHVAWQDNTPGNDEIFYSRSTNGGETFNNGSPVGTPRNLSNTPRASNDLQLLTEGTRVYVVWVDFTTGNGDIYFKRGTSNGANFGNTINLSRGSGFSFLSSRDPDMAAQGSRVTVIWTVYPSRTATGPGEIVFRESTNNGQSFGSHVVVSKTPRTDSKEPQVDYVPGYSEKYLGWNDRGGPQRVHTTPGTFNVLAAESNGRTVSASVNLSDAPNNPDKTKNTSQLQVLDDVAVMDPGGRRG